MIDVLKALVALLSDVQGTLVGDLCIFCFKKMRIRTGVRVGRGVVDMLILCKCKILRQKLLGNRQYISSESICNTLISYIIITCLS